jgi:hypothetical protein
MKLPGKEFDSRPSFAKIISAGGFELDEEDRIMIEQESRDHQRSRKLANKRINDTRKSKVSNTLLSSGAEIDRLFKDWRNVRRDSICPMPQPLRALLQCLHLNVREWLESDLCNGHSFKMPAKIDGELLNSFERLFKNYKLDMERVWSTGKKILKLTRVYLASLTQE